VALTQDLPLHLLEAELVDQPLHAGAELVLAVAVVVENPQDGFEGGKQLLTRREVLDRQRWVRRGPEPTGNVHTESCLGRAVGELPAHGDDPGVVEHRLPAIGGAPREVDLELPGKALADRVPQEVTERRLGPRGDVEHLVWACPGEMAGLDVPNGVAAGFTRRQPDRGQLAQQCRDLGELDEVELQVLAGRDVAPAPAVGLGDVGEHVELGGGEAPARRLDPDHLVGFRPDAGRRCRC
jgi:hypothetical protein